MDREEFSRARERHFFRLLILSYALQREKNIACILILVSIDVQNYCQFVIIKLINIQVIDCIAKF